MRHRGASAGDRSGGETDTAGTTSDEAPSAGTGALPGEKGAAASSSGNDPTTAFDCNICFDTPKDPVVTRCGHLYCWKCLYTWMRTGTSQCPVCKAGVERSTVTPIYGRGRTDRDDPRDRPVFHDEQLPPRPSGERATAPATGAPAAGAPPMHPGNPYWHPAAFGRLNAYANMNGNLALATFGNFPSLFGMEIAYPQFNEPATEMPRLTPEQETREQVAKVFLFLALFIILILTLF